MAFLPGHQKVGGRKVGSVNLEIKPIKLILASIKEANDWERWLKHADQQIAFEAFKLAQAYMNGKPAPAKEDNGDFSEMNLATLPEPNSEQRVQ